MLELKNLTVAYDDAPVFENLSIKFTPGKITGIIGANGAGKSTMLKAALGLINSKSGNVTYQTKPLKKCKAQIAYVEQRKQLDLNFPISVFEVVLSGCYPRLGLFNDPKKQDKKRVWQALEDVGLTDLAKRQIGELSGGQLQRVFVARAIVQDAQVIILDEPFVGIDLKSEQEIMGILQEWKAQNKTIIIVHHDLTRVYEYFDELVIVKQGILAHGPVKQVYTRDNISQAFSQDLATTLFIKEKV